LKPIDVKKHITFESYDEDLDFEEEDNVKKMPDIPLIID